MYKYKNITDMDHDVVGFGLVRAGETVETPIAINNPNFELVEGNPEQDAANAQAGQVPVEAPSPEQQVVLEPTPEPQVLPQEEVSIGGIQ